MDELHQFLFNMGIKVDSDEFQKLGRFADPVKYAIKDFDKDGITISFLPISHMRHSKAMYKIYSDTEFSLYLHRAVDSDSSTVLFDAINRGSAAIRVSVLCSGGRVISFECYAPLKVMKEDEKFSRFLCVYAGLKINSCKQITSPYGVDMFPHVKFWSSEKSFFDDLERFNGFSFTPLTYGDAEQTASALLQFRANEWGRPRRNK